MTARTIRVALVNEGAAGGLRKHVVELPRMMDRERFSITVILSTRPEYESEGDPAAELRESGIRCLSVPMVRRLSPFTDWSSLRALKQVLTRKNFDVVHAHAAKAGFLARYVCRDVLPCIYTPHVFAFQRCASAAAAAMYRAAERAAVPWTAAFVVTSEEEKRLALEMGAMPETVHVVRNAVHQPASLSEDAAAQVRKELGTPTDSTVFLTTGRLVDYKGHHTVIRAFIEAAASVPHAELWIAGEGEERPTLQALAAGSSSSRIRFLGHRPDMSELLAACSCFVLASQAEGCPYAVLEALAREKPIIATRVPGTMELLQDSPHWRLVPWNNVPALAQAMIDFTREPFSGAPLRSLPQEWFDVPGQVRKIESIYESVVGL